MSIGLFGAFERHNFGDWLMAHVAEELINEATVWLHDTPGLGYGIDSRCGNFLELGDFLSNEHHPKIIHTGGQTIGCSTLAAMEMNGLSSTVSFREHFYVLPEFIQGKKVLRTFFGIGGGLNGESQHSAAYLIESLSSANWLSVRESATKDALNSIGVFPAVAPDLVSLLPRLYPGEQFAERSGALFQLNKRFLTANFTQAEELLVQLVEKFGSVKVVAAGIAPGHDSWSMYANLVSNVRHRSKGDIKIDMSLSPLKIVEAIATSELVVSSSLHVRIVAMAYAVPRMSLLAEKTRAYAREWDVDEFFVTDLCEYEGVLSNCLSATSQNLEFISAKLSQLTETAWEEMISAIK